MSICKEINDEGNDIGIVDAWFGLVQICLGSGEFDVADEYFRLALQATERCYGAKHDEVARCTERFANLLVDSHRERKALPLLTRAVEIFTLNNGRRSTDVRKCVRVIAKLNAL